MVVVGIITVVCRLYRSIGSPLRVAFSLPSDTIVCVVTVTMGPRSTHWLSSSAIVLISLIYPVVIWLLGGQVDLHWDNKNDSALLAWFSPSSSPAQPCPSYGGRRGSRERKPDALTLLKPLLLPCLWASHWPKPLPWQAQDWGGHYKVTGSRAW